MSYRPSVQAEVFGAGTDYTLTTSLARIDFGTTDPEIILPTPGIYLVVGHATFLASVASAADVHQLAIRNSTDSVFISNNPTVTLGASFSGSVTATAVITITASKTIQLWAINATAARGVVQALLTSVKYIRLY